MQDIKVTGFAVIDLWKTTPHGKIHVARTAEKYEELVNTISGHEEIILVFEENGEKFFSRDIVTPIHTFIALK